jgi:hypothetical protein
VTELQARLAEKQNELNEINQREAIDQEDSNRRIKLINEISEIELEISQTAEREQKFAEHIDGLLAQIQELDPFGAMFPREQFNGTFGLTEYGEYQKQFNGLLYGILTDQQMELFSQHKDELAQKDLEIAALKETARAAKEREIQQIWQNDQLQDQLNRQEIVLQETEKRADAVEDRLAETERQLGEIKAERNALQSRLDTMTQLAQSEKPQAAPVVSQSLSERIAALKPVKSLKDMAADDLIKRFEDRQANGGKVEFQVPSLPEAATFPVAESQDNRISDESAETGGETADAVGFQAPEVPFSGAYRYTSDGEMEGTDAERMDATEARFREIERRLNALENQQVVA